MTTLEQLSKLLERVFEGEIDTAGLTEASLLREDVGLNSIAMLYMAVAIEEQFHVQLNSKTCMDRDMLLSPSCVLSFHLLFDMTSTFSTSMSMHLQNIIDVF